ncbi:MAG: cellulase N-terminal Ig-like domain-containing protein, partial [Ginsengibacter sp.]
MKKINLLVSFICFYFTSFCIPVIYINQIGFDAASPKIAVIGVDNRLSENSAFNIINVSTGKVEFTSMPGPPKKIDEWIPGKIFYRADFSSFKKNGTYKLSISINGTLYSSSNFIIEENALAKLTISSIIHYYRKQRANTPEELAADKHMLLYGSTKTVDVHGGWCDASGDVSNYFAHLAYSNFMSPQHTPLVTWSVINPSEASPGLLKEWKG